MDEAYASPSSDGHATLPSPTDSTFDLSLLPPPRKRRARHTTTTTTTSTTSSFIAHAPTSPDSSASASDTEPFPRWGGHQRMLPPSSSPAGSPRQQRLILREKDAASGSGRGENGAAPGVDVTANGVATILGEAPDVGESTAMVTARGDPRSTTPPGHTSPRRSLVSQGLGIEPQYPTSGYGYGRRRTPESRAAASSGDDNAPGEPTTTTASKTSAGEAPREASPSDTKPQPTTTDATQTAPDPRPGQTTPPADPPPILSPDPKPASAPPITPANKPPPRRRSAPPPPPTDPTPSPAHSFLGKTPRYLNWLNSSLDDAAAVPARYGARLQEALDQGANDESEFMAGDEASDDEVDKSFFGDDEELSPVLPPPPPGEGVDMYDGANDARTQPQPQPPKRKKKEKESKAKDAHHPVMGESTAAADAESDSAQLPPPPLQPASPTKALPKRSPPPMRQTSPTKALPKRSPPPMRQPSPTKAPPRKSPDNDPTMPQFFSNASDYAPAPLSSVTTTAAAARPSIAEVYKVAKPRSTTLIGKKSFNELLLASSEDAEPVYSLADLKLSGRARRVSMNTPPSSMEREMEHSGPPDFSSLGSGFSFDSVPVRYKGQQRKPDFDEDADAPSPSLGAPAKVMGSEEAGSEGTTVGREGSRSDPAQIRRWMESRGLVVPMRVGETKEMQDRRKGQRVALEEMGSEEYSEGASEDDGSRHWPGLTQRYSRAGAAPVEDKEKEPARAPEKGEAPTDPANLNNVEFRVHTPASVGDSKDISSDREGSSKMLWVRMAQAEAENNHFRKLLESNNIKIEDSFHDLSESIIDVKLQDSSSREDDFNVSTTEDVGSLRRRVLELEGLLQVLARKETELRAENKRKDNLVMHWRNQYNDVQRLALQNRQRALGLESHVKTLEQQAAADTANHDREINKVVSKLTERHDMVKNTRQRSLGLEERLAAAQNQVRDAQEALEEKERTITQLRQSIERRRALAGGGGGGSGGGGGEELQEKLFEQQQAHEASTVKLNSLLEEKDGLVRHLQAELDEMVNLMPVDHGSSRMIDEEEVEDWLDEKSREISQYYDDGLDQIITELHGAGEREDFEEAVEEAEKSLRKMAEQAGLDEPLDKSTLAAFGIRQLRTEHAKVKRRLADSEAKAKELAELVRRGDLGGEKLRASEEQRAALQTAVKEAEAAGKVLADQLDALRDKMATAEQHIRSLEAEVEALETKLADTEERAASLEEEKEALRVLVNDTKRLNEMLKSQAGESEQRRHTSEEETTSLRRQLAEEKAHVGVIETETITLRQQLTRREQAVTQEKEAAQTQLREALERQRALEREKDTLRRQLDDAARAQVASREAETLRRQLRELQDRIKEHAACAVTIVELEGKVRHGEQAAQRIAGERDFLKAELEVAVGETKAARGRFAQLLREESGRASGSGSGGDDTEAGACRRALHVIVTEIDRCPLPAHVVAVDDEEEGGEEAVDVAEGVQDPDLVRAIVGAVRARTRLVAEMDERGRRYKGAARRYMKDAERRKARVEELAAEVRELGVRLKAERRGNDEKMGQMILALRRGE